MKKITLSVADRLDISATMGYYKVKSVNQLNKIKEHYSKLIKRLGVEGDKVVVRELISAVTKEMESRYIGKKYAD